MGVLVYSNAFKAAISSGEIDLDNDSIKIALMNNSFVFDAAAHDTYANISSSELATANGYTVTGAVLANAAVAEDDPNNRANITYDDAVWTAAGGSIGPANGAIIYDDTVAAKTIICYDPFASALTATDTNTLSVQGIELRCT